MRYRLINDNPRDAVELPRVGVVRGFAPVFLTAAQIEPIVAALEPQQSWGTRIRLAALSGLRAAELAGLRVRDVNLAQGHIEVHQIVTKLLGEWTVRIPKSALSTRKVPLPDRTLIAELRELLIAHPDSGNPKALFWPARNYHG